MNIINYSELSRLLTGARTKIRSDYSKDEFKEIVKKCKEFETQLRIDINRVKRLK